LKVQLKIKAPFLPVHTKAEQKLFTLCMTQNLNVTDILEQFARKCDGINIFPKMHSHIEKHLKSWKEYGKNMQLMRQKSRPGICLLSESMILENSRENYTLEENDSSDEVNEDDVDYTSVDENDQIDERDTVNQYTEDGDILDDSIPEDSNLAIDSSDASITANRNEQGPHLDLQEDKLICLNLQTFCKI
jgi:hypothetical protein